MFTICYRRGDGNVETVQAKNEASLGGHLAHLLYNYPAVWVRRKPGGAIVLVYERSGGLDRP